MAAKFGAKSTTNDVLAGIDLKGKRILVTGASAVSVWRRLARSWRMAQML
jgi:hypothetical protein